MSSCLKGVKISFDIHRSYPTIGLRIELKGSDPNFSEVGTASGRCILFLSSGSRP
jgi:hypothetical protein